MALLSRDEILHADDLDYLDVDVPEWGGEVRIKAITAAERDRFEASITEQKKNGNRVNLINVRAKLLVRCIVDDHGNRMFSEDDIRALGRKSTRALQRCFEAATRLNAISEEDVEELAEDFDEDDDGGSTTG